jgi:hypothetical protein
MIVTCRTVEDFIQNLQAADSVLENFVRYDIVRRPIGNGDARKAVKFDVIFQACTVVRVDENTEYLLQLGVDCGSDYEDADWQLDGTEAAQSMKEKLVEAAGVCGLKVLPGMITSI